MSAQDLPSAMKDSALRICSRSGGGGDSSARNTSGLRISSDSVGDGGAICKQSMDCSVKRPVPTSCWSHSLSNGVCKTYQLIFVMLTDTCLLMYVILDVETRHPLYTGSQRSQALDWRSYRAFVALPSGGQHFRVDASEKQGTSLIRSISKEGMLSLLIGSAKMGQT